MTRLVVFDFDSTLLDMVSYVAALCLAAEEEFGIDTHVFRGELQRFYVSDPAGSPIGHDIVAHFRSHMVNLDDSNTQSRLVSRILSVHKRLTGHENLLFADVAPAIARLKASGDTDIAIMTVNLERSYAFKLLLCGDILNGVFALVVTVNKGVMMSQMWADTIVFNGAHYDTALVVDDHPEQIGAVINKPNIHRLQLVRPGQKYPANGHNVAIIPSLDKLDERIAA